MAFEVRSREYFDGGFVLTEGFLDDDTCYVKYWYNSDSFLHRVNGPAVEHSDGNVSWWLNGQRHREDGPAVITGSRKEWRQHGRLHRVDGPAIEDPFGLNQWWLNGQRHREDGPANGDAHYLFGKWIPSDIYCPQYVLEVKLNRIIET